VSRLLSRRVGSPQSKQKAHRVAGVIFLLVAAIDWWIVVEDGATRARVLAGIAASVAAVLELALPGKRGLLRRWRSAPGRD